VKPNDEGLSEVVDSTLIIALGLVLAGIVAAFVFGVFSPVDKSAYLVPQFTIINVSDQSVIKIFDRGGEPVYFNDSPMGTYKAVLYIDTQFGTYKAVPIPTLTMLKAGDTVFVYNSGTGFVMTDTLEGASFNSLPAGKIAVRFVDTTSGVLIAKEDLVPGATTSTETPATTVSVTTTATATATTTATITTTTTTTATTTITTTGTTTTTTTTIPATTIPPSLAANFDWDEKGKGGDVHFTDTSTGGPTSWSWNFGDGATSTTRSPVHNFGKHASSDVTLTITRSSDGATSSITKRITTI
jgi:FlaG/FlaF family flagellin (archaellin)